MVTAAERCGEYPSIPRKGLSENTSTRTGFSGRAPGADALPRQPRPAAFECARVASAPDLKNTAARQPAALLKMLFDMSGVAATVGHMVMTRNDYLLAGMHRASAVALSCAGTAGADSDIWTSASIRNGESQPRRFRLFHQPFVPAVDVRPDRKQGSNEKSHVSLTVVVCPARNVA